MEKLYTIVQENISIVFPTHNLLGSLRKWDSTGQLYAETLNGYRYQVDSYEIWEKYDTGIVQTKRDDRGLPVRF